MDNLGVRQKAEKQLNNMNNLSKRTDIPNYSAENVLIAYLYSVEMF